MYEPQVSASPSSFFFVVVVVFIFLTVLGFELKAA
jgi:hypothetical protein